MQLPRWLVCAAAALAACASSEKTDSPWDPVRRELIEMQAEDQAVRADFTASMRQQGRPDANVSARMRAVDRRNAARLQEIMGDVGWPRRADVGQEAADAAWLVAQHADHVPDFQEEVLEIVTPLVESGEVAGQSYALLTDRVRVARGLPQLFGTQYLARSIDGVLHFGPSTPIEDPEHLDERRARLGLVPHSQYVELVRKELSIPIHAPPLPTADSTGPR